jgi:hypothetical protein
MEHSRAPELPVALRSTVADLRKAAADPKTYALARAKNIGRLMWIAGFDIKLVWEKAPVDMLIEKLSGRKMAEIQPCVTRREVERRMGMRSCCLKEIKAALVEDIEAGRVKSLNDAIEQLRLPETPPKVDAQINLAEKNRNELDSVLSMMKSDRREQ